jgi:hypothetical protein
MGLAKRELERHDSLREQAIVAAVEAGALSRCDAHEEVLLHQSDDEAEKHAYALGTNMHKKGEVDGTRQEFMDSIKSVLEEAADECPFCAKNYAE